MLWCALTALTSLAGSNTGAETAVVQGAVADVRRLPSGDVEVALDQGRRYLVSRSASVTCDGKPAFFDAERKYAGGLAATLTLAQEGDRPVVRVDFSSGVTQVAATQVAATQVAATQVAATQVAATQVAATQVAAPQPNGAIDGLGEVNAARARRGLPPYLKDEGLTQGASRCAQLRAASFVHGHLGGQMSDFACLPPGSHASATGAGALTPDWGWGSCCTYDRYTYAGAAWVMGADGRRYMSLFVR